MKTFSLASITGALIFTTSSLAIAGPRPGPDSFRGPDGYSLRGGPPRPGFVVRGPAPRLMPRIVSPSPVVIIGGRREVVASPSKATQSKVEQPATPTPSAPTQSGPQVPSNSESDKPQKPGGQSGNGQANNGQQGSGPPVNGSQGNNSNKPSRPSK